LFLLDRTDKLVRVIVAVGSEARGRKRRRLLRAFVILHSTFALLVAAAAAPSAACVGSECMQVWSTVPGGGALAVEWDFGQRIRVFKIFCTSSSCVYSASDPGFIAPSPAPPGGAYHPLAEGTLVRVEIVSIDDDAVLQLQGVRLEASGQSAAIGTMPEIHAHPTWRLNLPDGVFGEYRITYKLTTDSPLYTASEPYTAVVVNVPPSTASPTPTPTPTPLPCREDCGPGGCVGDCNADGRVSLGEVVHAVKMALGSADPSTCTAANPDGGRVSVAELIAAVEAALRSCPEPVAFEDVQAIFTTSCAIATCHDTRSATGKLILAPGSSYEQLVGVEPDIFAAQALGFLRVDRGRPENSFLLVKLLGPPKAQGSRMPLGGDPLRADQIDLIRRWILEGAEP
jgi:hypothetical protein